MRLRLLLALAVSALALVAAGCGGGSASPTEQWAGSVCTDIDDWASQVKGVADDIQNELESPSVGLGASIQASVQQGVDDTKQLATNLKSLDPPPSENGQTAKQLIDSLADDVQQTVAEVEQQAKSLPSSPSVSQVATTIAAIAADISGTVTKAKSTITSIQELGSELEDSFDDASSCKDLKKQID